MRIAPNSSAARTIPIGLVRPSRATAMASKPTVVPYVVVIEWVAPNRSVAPAMPPSMPDTVIVQMIRWRGDMPA